MVLAGAVVLDVTRAVIGHVEKVLVDPDLLDARWLEVSLTDGAARVLVPAAAASEVAPGRLLVPYPVDLVAHAPRATDGVLTEDAAAALLRHYGLGS